MVSFVIIMRRSLADLFWLKLFGRFCQGWADSFKIPSLYRRHPYQPCQLTGWNNMTFFRTTLWRSWLAPMGESGICHIKMFQLNYSEQKSRQPQPLKDTAGRHCCLCQAWRAQRLMTGQENGRSHCRSLLSSVVDMPRNQLKLRPTHRLSSPAICSRSLNLLQRLFAQPPSWFAKWNERMLARAFCYHQVNWPALLARYKPFCDSQSSSIFTQKAHLIIRCMLKQSLRNKRSQKHNSEFR